MQEEGVIKFNCTWIKSAPVDESCIKELNAWRDILYSHALIGVTADNIGYGNISTRFHQNTFLISGSGTGKIEKLTSAYYTEVTAYDINENTLTAVGPVIASSESLTHAIIYESRQDVNAVFHVHHAGLWKRLLQTLPSTNKDVAYGTPAMAMEIIRLFNETHLAKHKIFSMGGHEDGIVSFGKDLNEAGEILLNALHKLQGKTGV